MALYNLIIGLHLGADFFKEKFCHDMLYVIEITLFWQMLDGVKRYGRGRY